MNSMQKIATVTKEEMRRIDDAEGWAYGCDKCKFGIVSQPPHSTTTTLVVQRVLQAMAGLVVFCDCQAGQLQHQRSRRMYKQMVEGDDYYSSPVIDADSRQPMIDEDGMAISWLNALVLRVTAESQHAPTIHFHDTKRGVS